MTDITESPSDGPAPLDSRYRKPRNGRHSIALRRVRMVTRAAVEAMRENQWVIPLSAIILGPLSAWALSKVGQRPDAEGWTVDVDRARDSLMGMLSLVFAGVSIVLAVATVTTQNVVSRFSLRMLRIYQRDLRDKVVVGTFAFTASFIMAEQFRLRGMDPDEPAPIAGVSVSLFLIFASGVTTIWYLNALSSWFRVDRTARRVARDALRGAQALEKRYADLDPIDYAAVTRTKSSSGLSAPRSGYFVGLDVDALYEAAVEHDLSIVIERIDGSSVVRGEVLGWVTSPEGVQQALTAEQLADIIDISPSLTLEGAVDYRVIVLVDIAIMALSPAVNDPNTAVQIIEELSFLLPELARVEIGPAVKADEQGSDRVVVNALGFGDYVDLATGQIVLYGLGDPAVRYALNRLVQVLATLDLSDVDSEAVDRLRHSLEGSVDQAERASG